MKKGQNNSKEEVVEVMGKVDADEVFKKNNK